MTQVTADEELEETVTRLMDILFQHSNWDLGILGNQFDYLKLAEILKV